MMMAKVIVPKKMPMSFMFITFFSMVVSGSDRPTTDIMKAMAVPRLTPLATKTSTTGTMPAALAYIGTARTYCQGYHQRSHPRKGKGAAAIRDIVSHPGQRPSRRRISPALRPILQRIDQKDSSPMASGVISNSNNPIPIK